MSLTIRSRRATPYKVLRHFRFKFRSRIGSSQRARERRRHWQVAIRSLRAAPYTAGPFRSRIGCSRRELEGCRPVVSGTRAPARSLPRAAAAVPPGERTWSGPHGRCLHQWLCSGPRHRGQCRQGRSESIRVSTRILRLGPAASGLLMLRKRWTRALARAGTLARGGLQLATGYQREPCVDVDSDAYVGRRG